MSSTPTRLHQPLVSEVGLYALRTNPDGRTVIRFYPTGAPAQTLPTATREGTELDIGTRVCEYSTDALALDGRDLLASDIRTGQIYRYRYDLATRGYQPPEPASFSAGRDVWRYTNIEVRAGRIFAIAEIHDTDRYPRHAIVEILDPHTAPLVRYDGPDFIAGLHLSPSGNQMAWYEWDLGTMPWDHTRLCAADLRADRQRVDPIALTDGTTAAIHPLFVTETDLLFIDDATGWWNIYRAELGTKVRIRHVHATDHDCADPPWTMTRPYVHLFGDFVAITWRNVGHRHLGELNWRSGELEDWVVGIEPISPLACHGRALALIGASATSAPALYRLDLTAAQSRMLEGDQPCALPEAWVSLPEALTWTTPAVPGDGIDPPVAAHLTHGFFYAPTPHDMSPDAPPLVVMVHGGPTSATSPLYRDEVQFFTTRGFAVLDVDHVGSSGYGRTYRQGLAQLWGVIDNADIIAGVRHLERTGAIGVGKAVIRGGSAGGYAVLRALTTSDVFAGGTSYYGVADLALLAGETHKFEARYLDGLIGRYPQEAERYAHRSPLGHLERINAPVLLLQGERDPIVPAHQARAVYEKLHALGKPVALRCYPDESHGFRAAEVIADSLAVELAFYCDILDHRVADELPAVPYAH
ncbi:MAG: prolyl oligopeptidase family serine peptidase [Bowdeniella nasicola]|nr:prolyl oligopeptidase family serine peptidase [Bowdeniella nasicola]